ncbi:MAG TPA: radical SAM family heme chaperone HemW [Cyclobacteriaceae bacterium]
MSGIYIHIPYCRKACHYCDFHFSTNLKTKSSFIESLLQEIALRKDFLRNTKIQTLYFGGGTPSLLNYESLREIIAQCYKDYDLSQLKELTIECNPDDLDLEKLSGLKTLGFNRLSIGVQSFQNEVLTLSNRSHTSQQALTSFEKAREVGFYNISIDLMYGFTGFNIQPDLEQITILNPEHISIYGLTIENQTAFGHWVKNGTLKPMDEETESQQYENIIQWLQVHGYEHYEISNFSKPGYYSMHNTAYWSGKEYLGLGPSAHSYNGITRQVNVSNNIKYIKYLNEKILPAHCEILTEKDRANDYLLTSLRTNEGTDVNFLHTYFGYPVQEYQRIIIKFIKQNLITQQGSKIKLNQKGKLLMDNILSELLWI